MCMSMGMCICECVYVYIQCSLCCHIMLIHLWFNAGQILNFIWQLAHVDVVDFCSQEGTHIHAQT